MDTVGIQRGNFSRLIEAWGKKSVNSRTETAIREIESTLHMLNSRVDKNSKEWTDYYKVKTQKEKKENRKACKVGGAVSNIQTHIFLES